MIRFIVVLISIGVLLIVAVRIGLNLHWISAQPSYLYKTTIFLVIITAVIYVKLYNAETPDFFTRLYLLSMAVKLLAALAFNVVMILDDLSGKASNVVYFMVSYLLFTLLEISFLYRKIARN